MVMAGATSILVAGALGWTFVLRPTIESYREARDKVTQLQDQIERAKALIKRKPELQSERNRIEHSLAGDELVLSPTIAVTMFDEHLRVLLEQAGLALSEIRTVRTDPYDAYAELHIELRAKAPLRQIKDFMVRMTASEWYLRVQAIQITPQHDNQTVEVTMSLLGLATQDALEEDQRKEAAKEAAKGRPK
jgi:Tfp pilus assembly protein PilO